MRQHLIIICVLGGLAITGCTRRPVPPPATVLSFRTGPAGMMLRFDATVVPERFPGDSADVTISFQDEAGTWHGLRPLGLVRSGSGGLLAEGLEGEVPGTPARLTLVIRDSGFRWWVDGRTSADLTGRLSARPQSVAVVMGPSAGIHLKLVSQQRLQDFRFTDHFMTEEPPAQWEVASGQWHLKGMSFGEHALNPFCLAAGDPTGTGAPSRSEPDELGLGFRVGQAGEYPVVVRLAGNAPATRAGMEVGDTIIEVNGRSTAYYRWVGAFDALFKPYGQVNQVTVRRGPLRIEMALTRERRRWGDPQRIVALPGSRERTGPHIATTGWWFWRDYSVSASVRPAIGGAAGLLFYYRPDDFFLFRLCGETEEPGRALRAELVRVVDGREQVLAHRAGGPLPGQWYRMKVTVSDQTARAFVDGREILSVRSDSLIAGAAGCYSTSREEVLFDDFAVLSADSDAEEEEELVPEALRQDPKMRHWANPEEEWTRQAETGVWWHRLPWPGDLRLEWPQMQSAGVTVYFGCGKPGSSPGGYRLHVQPLSRSVTLTDGRGNFRVEHRFEEKATRGERRLSVRRHGTKLTVQLAAGTPWTVTLPEAPPGERLGVAGVPNAEALGDLRVRSTRVISESFTQAPVRWLTLGGRWGSVNRWICDPRWSYHGGVGEALVALRSKRAFGGDFRLDGFLAPMMTTATPPFERFEDIYVSIMADPRRPASGYTVAYRPQGRRVVELWRNGRIVAVSRAHELFFPASTFQDQWVHRSWQHFTLERRGPLVSFRLGEVDVFAFEDPEPIQRGHVALSTVENGLLLARLRLAFENKEQMPLPERQWTAVTDWAVTNVVGGEVSTLMRRTDDGYQVANRIGGGPFAVALRPRFFAVARHPRLTFRFRAEPGAQVDLWFESGPDSFRVPLTGPATSVRKTMELPRLPGVAADDEWHEVDVDLQQLLRDAGSPALHDFVRNLRIGSYAVPLRMGAAPDAKYWISDIHFAEAESE